MKICLVVISAFILFSGCIKEEFGGLGIRVPNGPDIVTKRDPFVIVSVFEGSAGEKAGLQAGDIISAVNGRSIEGLTCDYVVDNLLRGKVGEMVTVEILRGEKVIDFTIPRGRIILDE